MPGSSISGLSSLGECPICLGGFDNAVYTTCGHRFCHSCIRSHIYVSRLAMHQAEQNQLPSSPPACPLCRHPISEHDFVAAPFLTSASPSPRASLHGVEVLVRFAHSGSLPRPDQNGNRRSVSHRQNQMSELAIPLQPMGGGGGGGSGDGGTNNFGVNGLVPPPSRSSVAIDATLAVETRRNVRGPNASINNGVETTALVRGGEADARVRGGEGVHVASLESDVSEPSLLWSGRLRHFNRRSIRSTPHRGHDPESKQLITRLCNLIILSSFIMVIQGIVSVCFWEYSINVKSAADSSKSVFGSSAKGMDRMCRPDMLEWVERNFMLLRELNSSLEAALRSEVRKGSKSNPRSFANRKFRHSKEVVRDLSARMKSRMNSLEQCLRDEEFTPRKKSTSSSSSVMSTLPLVIFLVSVSVVPVLILGLYLLTHKCKTQV